MARPNTIHRHEFAMYAGDDFVASGTREELAEKYGVTTAYIKYLSTPAHQRRLAKTIKPRGNAKYVVKLGPMEDE